MYLTICFGGCHPKIDFKMPKKGPQKTYFGAKLSHNEIIELCVFAFLSSCNL